MLKCIIYIYYFDINSNSSQMCFLRVCVLLFVVVSCSAQCYFERLQVGVLPLQDKMNRPEGTVSKTQLFSWRQGVLWCNCKSKHLISSYFYVVVHDFTICTVCFIQVVLILKDRLMSLALSGSQLTVTTVCVLSLALAAVTSRFRSVACLKVVLFIQE